ncbi:aspartate aminotransferase family protein, partial [Dietzia sp. DQ12-76]|nr:aspartate aminotransferase family protein [Dietzia sp. DQ12-76]
MTVDHPDTDPLESLIDRRGAAALETLAELRAADPPTTGGRVLSYVYDSGLEGVDRVAVRAAGLAH